MPESCDDTDMNANEGGVSALLSADCAALLEQYEGKSLGLFSHQSSNLHHFLCSILFSLEL